jgi:GNAT superfamily N-acetyltransferase
MTMRQASLAEVRQMLDWAQDEGWNPGLGDAEAFHAADPAGFFVAEADGAPVAAISVVNHSGTFAFLGLYLCRPAYRGRGLGHALWRHALAHAGARTVGLDGVPAQEGNYARSGFVRTEATLRLEGRIAPAAAPQVREAGAEDAAEIARLDLAATGVARERFVAAWSAKADSRRTLVLAGDGGLRGFATVRRCVAGVKVGPVVAPDAAAALALVRAAVARLPAEPAIIDVPEGNAAFRRALEERGFRETFRTARMYRGQPPTAAATLMAIATMELG